MWPKKVFIREVGPRDGLQNEGTFVETDDKVEWINLLSTSGITAIEVSSFVHPKWIPALRDAADVFRRIRRVPGVTYSALVPNVRGLERGLEAGIDEAVLFVSASESHNLNNVNKSIRESLMEAEQVVNRCAAAGISVRAYVSTVFGCPFEGSVSVSQTMYIVQRFLDMGIQDISLADTIGVANPGQVEHVLEEVEKITAIDRIALHFHDTRGLGLANVAVSLKAGVTRFESSLGGLGGCPYAPGALGNICTEDLLYMLHGIGLNTGVDMDVMIRAARMIQDKLGKSLPSCTLQVWSKE